MIDEDLNNAINYIKINDFNNAFISIAKYANEFIYTEFKNEDHKTIVALAEHLIDIAINIEDLPNIITFDRFKARIIKVIETIESEDMESLREFIEVQNLIIQTELGMFP